MKFCYILQHGNIGQVKEATHQRPHTVSFYLYETSRLDKSREIEGSLVLAVGWWQGGIGYAVMGIKFLLG